MPEARRPLLRFIHIFLAGIFFSRVENNKHRPRKIDEENQNGY